MSKIKWGALVVDGRGKLGGHVLSKNRSGAIIRTKVTPVNPQTTAQAAARSRLGSQSQAWRSLSEADRRAWNAAASEFAKTNVFGDQYFPSGKNLFTGINSNMLLVEEAALDTPKEFQVLPVIIDASVAVDTTLGTITVTTTTEGDPEDVALIMEATQSFSAGKYNFSGAYRFIIKYDPTSAPTAAALYAAYIAKFGAPVPGKKVGFRFYFISTKAGNASPRFSTATTIV